MPPVFEPFGIAVMVVFGYVRPLVVCWGMKICEAGAEDGTGVAVIDGVGIRVTVGAGTGVGVGVGLVQPSTSADTSNNMNISALTIFIVFHLIGSMSYGF
jgi:hypothetical protein